MEKNVEYCDNCKYFTMHYTFSKAGFEKLYYGHCINKANYHLMKKMDDTCPYFEAKDIIKENKIEAFKDTILLMSEKLEYLSEIISQDINNK